MRAAASSHSGEATTPLGPCKLTCFFATPPNTGLGTTAGPAEPSAPGHDRHAQAYPESASTAQPPQPSAATNAFYEQLGSIAAGSGVCVDMFAIGRQPLGLAALTPLCRKSGGACFFYPSVEGSALPQVRASNAWPLHNGRLVHRRGARLQRLATNTCQAEFECVRNSVRKACVTRGVQTPCRT